MLIVAVDQKIYVWLKNHSVGRGGQSVRPAQVPLSDLDWRNLRSMTWALFKAGHPLCPTRGMDEAVSAWITRCHDDFRRLPAFECRELDERADEIRRVTDLTLDESDDEDADEADTDGNGEEGDRVTTHLAALRAARKEYVRAA